MSITNVKFYIAQFFYMLRHKEFRKYYLDMKRKNAKIKREQKKKR